MNDQKPPRLALRFLARFCPTSLHEGIEGDLTEQFEEDFLRHGASIAKRRFYLNVLKFCRPEIILRNKFKFGFMGIHLLRSYFLLTFRNLLKSKGYSFINIFGLSLGLAICLLTYNYVRFETSFDTMHHDVDRMYSINQTNIWDPSGGVFNSTGPAVASALKSEFAEIDEIIRVNTPGGQTVRYEKPGATTLAFNEQKILAADSNFFNFFYFPLKEGDAKTALIGKNKVVLSDKAAKRLFGEESPIGKIILLGDERTAIEVTGVTEPQPDNMHFHFDYLLSMETNPWIKRMEWSWIFTQVVTYIKLNPSTDVASFEAKLKDVPKRYVPASLQRFNMNYEEFMKEKGGWFLYIHPVKDIYLHSDKIGNRLGAIGDIKYVYILSFASLFILLIAIVNFVNLSTARGATRAKEVGVKKTLGLVRRSLIAQFQVEHITITTISVLLGIAIMEVLRAVIAPMAGINIPTDYGVNTILILTAVPIIIGFLAGLYPAFYLTRFNPAQVLKGRISAGMRSSGLRNALVVFQFTISIALMAATLIVFQQLNFFQNKSLGLDKENLLIIENGEKLGNQLKSLRDEIAKYPGVLDATVSMNIRGGFEDLYTPEGTDRKVSISLYKVDEHFLSTTKIELASGRGFDPNRPADVNAIVINETTAKLIGWSNEEAIGKHIRYLGDAIGPQEVIGVAKDFHFQSLRQNIMPFMFSHLESRLWGDSRIILVKYKTDDLRALISKIETRWNQIAEATPFHTSFYDEEVKKQYEQEQRLGSLFSMFTILSMAIAVVGLVGLVAYSAETRKKEIGIRKVFGASVPRIMLLMNSQYVKLIFVSILLASPLTWWLLQKWLETFAYRVDVSPVVFVIAGVAELLLALVSVGYLSLRAASANPVSVLKDE
jgi:putative ABC transport system permease protein